MAPNIKDYRFFRALKALPWVEQILLYGSRARGTARARSDIDLAIVCPHASREEWVRIPDILDKAVKRLKEVAEQWST